MPRASTPSARNTIPKGPKSGYVALGAVAVVTMMIGVVSLMGSTQEQRQLASVQGWCCLADADSCMSGYTAIDCYNASGFAFNVREDMCRRACDTHQ